MPFEVTTHPAAEGKVACPMCGSLKLPFLLISVSSLPSALTGGAAYACDGCWSSWERNQVEYAPGVPFREEHLYAAQGAPTEFVNHVAALLDHRDATIEMEQGVGGLQLDMPATFEG